MRIKCIDSGSHGNCYLLQIGSGAILLDVGVAWKEVLRAIDYNLSAIDFALITHSHG